MHLFNVKYCGTSISHQLAPVEIREKVAFASSELPSAISIYYQLMILRACVIFSTCNRSEIYVSHNSKNIRDVLLKFLASTHAIDHLSSLNMFLFLNLSRH